MKKFLIKENKKIQFFNYLFVFTIFWLFLKKIFVRSINVNKKIEL